MSKSREERPAEMLESLKSRIRQYIGLELERQKDLPHQRDQELQLNVYRDTTPISAMLEPKDIQLDKKDKNERARINKDYQRRIQNCNTNLSKLEHLLADLNNKEKTPAIKISTVYNKLKNWYDGEMRDFIFPPAAESELSWADRIALLLSNEKKTTEKQEREGKQISTEPKQTPDETAIQALIDATRKYRDYIENNKIMVLQEERRKKEGQLGNKYGLQGYQAKLDKLNQEYQVKIDRYTAEATKIGTLLENLKKPHTESNGPKEKLAAFQKDFQNWKEKDMKWRMFRSRTSRGKGQFSEKVAKIYHAYRNKVAPPKVEKPTKSMARIWLESKLHRLKR